MIWQVNVESQWTDKLMLIPNELGKLMLMAHEWHVNVDG